MKSSIGSTPTPEERMQAVWQITLDAWAMLERNNAGETAVNRDFCDMLSALCAGKR